MRTQDNAGNPSAWTPFAFKYDVTPPDDPIHDIAVNGAGKVFVAWRTGGLDTALATRNGENWSPPQIIWFPAWRSQIYSMRQVMV